MRLPDVTVLAATSVAVEETTGALAMCAGEIEFRAVKLLAPRPPAMLPAGIQHVVIPPMDLLGYSRFVLGKLHEHFETSHCLVVQADGFVLNPSLWRDEFLAYDYIGAPWPEYLSVSGSNALLRLDRNRVGNGGFSLRSRRLTKLAATIRFDRLDLALRSEDMVLCHFLFEEMRARGITYAPFELALRFSMETPGLGQRLDDVFGFHGKHLLPDVLTRLYHTRHASHASI